MIDLRDFDTQPHDDELAWVGWALTVLSSVLVGGVLWVVLRAGGVL